jgi:hypothetical protein
MRVRKDIEGFKRDGGRRETVDAKWSFFLLFETGLVHGSLTEREGSVRLTSVISKLVL